LLVGRKDHEDFVKPLSQLLQLHPITLLVIVAEPALWFGLKPAQQISTQLFEPLWSFALQVSQKQPQRPTEKVHPSTYSDVRANMGRINTLLRLVQPQFLQRRLDY
jgi:hypothetical protein